MKRLIGTIIVAAVSCGIGIAVAGWYQKPCFQYWDGTHKVYNLECMLTEVERRSL